MPVWRGREGKHLGGLELLRELPIDGALCVALWRVLRYVEAWTTAPPEERERAHVWPRAAGSIRALLREAHGEGPELARPFALVSRHLKDPHRLPQPAAAALLARACARIAQWAEQKSLLQTAVHYAEAAAFTDPEVPKWHRHAGRLCRRAGMFERAELWFRRGYHLAARDKHRSEAVRTLLGYGKTLKDQGKHDEARVWLARAARRAKWEHRPWYAAEAHHDLGLLETESGELSAATGHYREALRLYPPSSERIPYLVHDAAVLLMRRHHYSHAVPLLERVLAAIHRPEEQILVWGSLAKAGAAAQRRDQYAQAEAAIRQLAPLYNEHAGAAFIHLAEGARAFEEWEKAAVYADAASSIAAERSDELIGRDAAALAVLVERRVTVPQEEMEPPTPGEVEEELVRSCRWKLRTWKPPRIVN